MKRLFTLINLLLFASSLTAQTTTVSATVVDSDSVTWANGSWGLTFTPNPSNPNPSVYNINGTPLSPSVTAQSGVLNSSGVLSFSVYQTATIAPSGSSWTLKVCPNAVTACGIYNFTAIGTSMDLSSVLTSIIPVPRYHAISGTYGYTDNEAILQLIPGNTYWNVSMLCQRVYNGTTWVCLETGAVTGCVTGDVVGWAQFSNGTGGCASEFIDSEVTHENALTIQPSPGDQLILDPTIGFTREATTTIYGDDEDNAIDLYASGTINTDAQNISSCGYNGPQTDSAPGHCPNGQTTTQTIYGEFNVTDGEIYTDGGLELQGGFGGGFLQFYPYQLIAGDSPYTLDYSPYFEPSDATVGNITINLDDICPTPTYYCNDGLTYLFTKEDTTSNTITILPYTGQTIAGNSSYVLSTQFQAVELVADYNGNVGGTPTWVIKNQSSGGSGPVTTIVNSDGTLVISPTTGNVVASLNLAHSNTWTANQNHLNTTDEWNVTSPSNPAVAITNAGYTASSGTGQSILYNSAGIALNTGGSSSNCWNTAGGITGCTGGGMIYPGGTGIPAVVSGTSWGSTYNASNLIPFNFLNTSVAHIGTCPSGQYSNAATNSGLTCAQIAYSQVSGTPTIITPIQLVLGTSTINANTCTTPVTVTMIGLVLPSGITPGSTFRVSYEGNPTGTTGWGASGGLSLKLWVSATNTLQWSVCNTTSGTITPGALNVDVGAN